MKLRARSIVFGLTIATSLSAFAGIKVNGFDLKDDLRTEEKSGLSYRHDTFGNVHLDQETITKLKTEKSTRVEVLKNFVAEVSPNEKGNVIFAQLPNQLFGLGKDLKAAGFTMHFANTDWAQWKVQNGSPMPDPFTATMGTRAIIMNEKGEILVIEDKNMQGRLMFPGGNNDRGELVVNAALREAKEEVGIDLNELSLVAEMNRTGGNRYGANDECKYYLSHVTGTPAFKIQESEILWAGWVKLDDILEQKQVNISENKALKASMVTMEILNHIKNGERSSMKPLPDLRQMPKKPEERDPKDILHLQLISFQK